MQVATLRHNRQPDKTASQQQSGHKIASPLQSE